MSPEDLIEHPCLIMNDSTTTKHWTLTSSDSNGKFKLNSASFVNDFISIKSMATCNAGIALLPEYAVFEDVRSGRLSPILNDWCGPATELSAIYPSRRGATAKVRLLIEEVKQHLSSVIN